MEQYDVIKSHVAEVVKDYNVSQDELKKIHDVMDEVRSTLREKGKYSPAEFERKIKGAMKGNRNEQYIDYHFVKEMARAFMEDDRWAEVYPALYGDKSE